MDQRKLDAQMLEEDEKAGGLRRTRLMPQLAKVMSENITLTNDISYVSDPFLIEWHERMPEWLKWRFRKCPAVEMREKLQLAREVFIHNNIPDNIDHLTMGKAMETVLKKELKFAVDCSKRILKFVNYPTKVHKNILDVDVQSLFLCPVPCAWEHDIIMELVEEALVSRCFHVRPILYIHCCTPPPRCICRTRW